VSYYKAERIILSPKISISNETQPKKQQDSAFREKSEKSFLRKLLPRMCCENSCTFSGGQNQIVVGGDASNVLIMGITFTGPISAAVVSSGSESSDVTVKQCNFMVSGNPIELEWFPESDNEISFINDNSHSCFFCGLLTGIAFRVILVMLEK